MAFVVHAAGQPAYVAALGVLDGHVATLTRERLARAHGRIDRGHLPALREFDLIRGLTGIGAYLLHRHGGGDLLRDVLSYLVRLSEPQMAGGVALPGWWSDHGVVTGHAEAIVRIVAWLNQWRSGTRSRAWWPETISLSEWRTGAVRQPGPQRPSWCYGTPGLARAQQLAALALRLQARLEEHLHRRGPPPADGLLEGTAGVRLVEHTVAGTAPPTSGWDACLLLDG